MPLDNKISNIIGAKLPQWVLNQIGTRSNKNTQESRVNDNDNILYLANKTAWVRLVSSVDIIDQRDLNYFKKLGASLDSTTASLFGTNIDLLNPSSLAKQYVLFGGTSKYLNKNSYQLRSGIGSDGAYGMLGTEEIQKYGYKPMPGITSVNIETQGRLGSVRAATINFKCWDKAQLDIMDALYFKLGFTMFLEWGHTYFYYSPENSKKRDPNKVFSTDVFSLDPFQANLSKEKVLSIVAKNSRESEGNYDGMLGMVTNFNFTYTQDGGYDCTIRLMALGALADGIKINNPLKLPDLLKEEIIELNNTLIQINQPSDLSSKQPSFTDVDPANDLLANLAVDIPLYIPDTRNLYASLPAQSISEIAFANTPNNTNSQRAETTLRSELKNNGDRIVIPPYTANLNITNLEQYKTIDKKQFYQFDYALPNSGKYIIADLNLVLDRKQKYSNIGIDVPSLKDRYLISFPQRQQDFFQLVFNTEKRITTGTGAEVRGYENLSETKSYIYELQYKSKLGKIYFFQLELDPQLVLQDPEANQTFSVVIDSFQRKNIIQKIFSNGDSVFRDPELIFTPSIFDEVPGWPFFSYQFSIGLKYKYSNAKFTTPAGRTIETSASVNIKIRFNDSSLFTSDINPSKDTALLTPFGKTLRDRQLAEQNVNNFIDLQNQREQDEALTTQITQALNYQSSLEIILRTIQLHSLNKAIGKRGLSIGNQVYIQELWDPTDIPLKNKSKKTFLQQIFSNGIFSSFIQDLIDNKISNLGYEDTDGNAQESLDEKRRLQIQSKYGFATNLMANKASLSEIESDNVNFKELLKAYVVPYEINQELIKGTQINHPVYIPLGQLLMLLNHTCTIYDTNKKSNFQTPLVYIDFNPNLNYCLTNTKQLSTNPWVTLIPFQGSFKDYTELFDEKILNDPKTQILPLAGNKEGINLFNPEDKENGDALSGSLPKFKFTGKNSNVYRGSIMNILLNIDYLIKLAQDYSTKDESHSVYLKPYIEKILSDINKYLGDFNAFRLSYNDQGNTFQIVDDQLVPGLSEEESLSPTNRTELPLLGKFSIAKSLEIKTDISNKLSNMIAISANSTIPNKAVLSVNGDSFGYINTNYVDRYINDKLDPGGNTDLNKQLDTVKTSAAQFNQAISDFYSKINPSEATVAHATNYYIERMSKIKNNEYATRASTLIPISINFTTDGISGLAMGQGFTVPDELLPYTYNVKKLPGLPKDHVNNTGFVVVGLSHTIENNSWNTSVRANMLFLKDKTEFKGTVEKVEGRVGTFGINTSNPTFSGPTNLPESVKNSKAFQDFISIPGVKARVESIASELGIKPDDLYVIFKAETGGTFNPAVQNPDSQAVGLIQFLPSTAQSLGTTTQALKSMGALEQLEFVRKYFLPNKGQYKNAYDLYLQTFFPLAVGKPQNFVIESQNQSAKLISEQNPAIARAAGKKAGDPLTVADFYKYVASLLG